METQTYLLLPRHGQDGQDEKHMPEPRQLRFEAERLGRSTDVETGLESRV